MPFTGSSGATVNAFKVAISAALKRHEMLRVSTSSRKYSGLTAVVASLENRQAIRNKSSYRGQKAKKKPQNVAGGHGHVAMI